MILFLVKRLITLVLTLFVAALVVFTVLEVLPGDPAAIILGTGAQPDTLAALRKELGLDLPAPVRFFDGWAGCCKATWAGATPTACRWRS